MSAANIGDRIAGRAALAGCEAPSNLTAELARYLSLLAHWNRTLNLTSLPLEPPTDEALDRLLIEPLVAAPHVRDVDRLCLDIGSGGGSPAIPLKIARPQIRLVMVEARARKAAFLQEAVRHLALADTSVETGRFESLLEREDLAGKADLVTVRAVRLDDKALAQVAKVLRPSGRLFWFAVEQTEPPPPWREGLELRLPGGDSRLHIWDTER